MVKNLGGILALGAVVFLNLGCRDLYEMTESIRRGRAEAKKEIEQTERTNNLTNTTYLSNAQYTTNSVESYNLGPYRVQLAP